MQVELVKAIFKDPFEGCKLSCLVLDKIKGMVKFKIYMIVLSKLRYPQQVSSDIRNTQTIFLEQKPWN